MNEAEALRNMESKLLLLSVIKSVPWSAPGSCMPQKRFSFNHMPQKRFSFNLMPQKRFSSTAQYLPFCFPSGTRPNLRRQNARGIAYLNYWALWIKKIGVVEAKIWGSKYRKSTRSGMQSTISTLVPPDFAYTPPWATQPNWDLIPPFLALPLANTPRFDWMYY